MGVEEMAFITLTDIRGKRIFIKRTSILGIIPFRQGSKVFFNGTELEVLEDKVTVLEMILEGGRH
jgi:hypothetical protein